MMQLNFLNKIIYKSEYFNIEGINFPAGKDDAIELFKQNNLRVHCVCAMTNSERFDHFITE